GTIIWNSHAFNPTKYPTTNEQWFTLFFAPPGSRSYPLEQVFEAEEIFVPNVPPFEQREYCRTCTVPQHGRLFQLRSHTHKRAKLFRIGGPGIAADCTAFLGCQPEPGQPFYTTTDYANPTVMTFSPPTPFDSPDPTTRRFKFCALYDNGATNPTEVKRRSTS